MEKIKDFVNKELPPLRLYLDELRELHEVLTSHCKETVIIEACGYRFKNLDELDKLPSVQTNNIYLSSYQPYVKVRLTQTHGEIYVSDGSLESEGLASRLENILLRGKLTYPFWLNNFWVAVLLGTPLGLGIALQNVPIIKVGAILLLFSLGWAGWYYHFATRRYNTIVFKNRKDTPSFWKRNKDEIIMLVVGTFIGVIITTIVGLFLK